ncbi:MAG: hypothetical protein ACI84R_000275 [Candidatus Azotimanducaceae bacterium]|jgi:hypothetical protein
MQLHWPFFIGHKTQKKPDALQHPVSYYLNNKA